MSKIKVIKIKPTREITPLNEMKRDVLELGKDDAKMMASPDLWPQWPYLPLRNRSREPKPLTSLRDAVVGFLIASEDRTKTTVFLGTTYEKSVGRRTERFNSFQEIVDAGWEVD